MSIMQVAKKLFLLALILSFSLVNAGAVLAAGNYTFISGPNGGQVLSNGWYKYDTIPYLTINSVADNNCWGSGTGNLSLNPGGGDNLGSHVLKFTTSGGDITVYRDGNLLRGMCSASGVGSIPTEVIWEGRIKYDHSAPYVIINSSHNNANTSNASIVITGTSFDIATTDSSPQNEKCTTSARCAVLSSVTVNGVGASISGDTFSATVPLNIGLNTITATAVDNAGQSAKSSAITVFRSDEVQDDNSNDSTVAITQSTNGDDASSQNPTSAPSQQVDSIDGSADDNKGTTDEETETIVKGVVQAGGVSIATILIFVVILLLLDKFRAIEIKAFSNLTKKFSKKTKK